MNGFWAGAVFAVVTGVLIIGLYSSLHHAELDCLDMYGAETREFAICVYEINQGIRQKP